jgi:hypothetical protein
MAKVTANPLERSLFLGHPDEFRSPDGSVPTLPNGRGKSVKDGIFSQARSDARAEAVASDVSNPRVSHSSVSISRRRQEQRAWR